MATRLEGKVAVITGGGSGIGRATALRFLDEGASVVVADLNRKTGQETAAMARERGHGERIRFVRCDVSVEAEVAEAVDVATRELGRLDCIFNNAGAGGAGDDRAGKWGGDPQYCLDRRSFGRRGDARLFDVQGRGDQLHTLCRRRARSL